jgi:hypothetical protein
MRTICLFCSLLLLYANLSLAADTKTTPDGTQEKNEKGFVALFDGKTLDGWQGSTKGYAVEDGAIVCRKGGNLYTDREYADFVLRFEVKIPPGGNNGVGIRTPPKGYASYLGMEIQVLDNKAKKYANLKPYQYHGSIYGAVPAKRGFLKPAGQWNCEEISCKGGKIKITLNGTVIVDADLSKIKETVDREKHPGLHSKKGHIGFLGHGSPVAFRNIRIKKL